MMLKQWVMLAWVVICAGLGGCATVLPPSQMLETEVYKKMVAIKAEEPKEKIYRQYVSDGFYIQMDRMDENHVFYGWYTCTNCNWTRAKILAVYDGSYLYMIYGHHEEFFLESPKDQIEYPEMSHWSWGVIEKFQVEGRNLIKLGQIRKCVYDDPMIKEWSNAPWDYDGDFDCRYAFKGTYNTVFVATTDDTLIGEKSSIVGESKDAVTNDVRTKIAALKELFDEGLIDQATFEAKKKKLIDDM